MNHRFAIAAVLAALTLAGCAAGPRLRASVR